MDRTGTRVEKSISFLLILSVVIAFFFSAFESVLEFFTPFLPWNALLFAMIASSAFICIIKHFKLLIKDAVFVFLLIFSSFSLLFYFYHSSSFNVGLDSIGYLIGDIGDNTSVDAKFIALITAFGMFFPYVVTRSFQWQLADARLSKNVVKNLISFISRILVLYCVVGILTSLFLDSGFYSGIFGFYSSFLLFAFSVYFVGSDNEFYIFKLPISLVTVLTSLLVVLTMPIFGNKTMFLILMGGFFSFIILLKQSNFHIFRYIALLINNTPELKSSNALLFYSVPAVAICSLLFLQPSFLFEKVDYFVHGFGQALHGGGSLGIRINNLSLFFEQWFADITIGNLFFGHGLGASRESIFYLTTFKKWSIGAIVQTVHNSYIEFFYDYGFIAFFYFFSLVLIAKRFINAVRFHPYKPFRLLVISGLMFLWLICIYGLTDGIKVEFQIQQFSVYGLLSALILFDYRYLSQNKEIFNES